jgi:hypothetical protein
MGAITSLSDLINKLTNGSAQHYNVFIDNRVDAAAATNPASGTTASLWRYNKSTGASGLVPPTGSGEAPTRLTLGALRHTNAASGKELWLTGIEVLSLQAGILFLYDRLFHCRGLSGIVTSAQAVNSVPLTRSTGGVGNQIWLEIYTTIGATVTTITVTYVNQAGVTRTTPPVVWGGTNVREQDRLIRLPLDDGDTGVQGIVSVQQTASTGTAGDFGVTIAKPMTRGFVEGPNCAAFRDLLTGIPAAVTIPDDACLALMWQAVTTVSPRIDFTYHAVEA